ncbi:MAG: hypothetical protein ACRCY8_02915 [Dermatophilaceae bacterium]
MSAATLLAHADALVSGTPLLQVAVDGWWERAREISLPTTTAIHLEPAGDLAVELLWWGPPAVFVGARFVGERPPIDRLVRPETWTPSAAVEVLLDGLVGSVTHVELGQVNAWRSVGPSAIPVHASHGQVEHVIDTRPDLRAGPGAVALEMVIGACRAVWCGVETGADAGRIVQVLDVARQP